MQPTPIREKCLRLRILLFRYEPASNVLCGSGAELTEHYYQAEQSRESRESERKIDSSPVLVILYDGLIFAA